MSCCVKCHKGELEEQQADIPATVKGESVLVTQFPALVCAKCRYQTVSGARMPEYMRLAADVYRRKHALLTSDEIRYRRERLNQNQEEFAEHLGVGIASVKRWEMGQVQDRAMDRLIRIRTDLHDAYNNYKKLERLLEPPVEYCVPDTSTIWHKDNYDDDDPEQPEQTWLELNLPPNLRRAQSTASCS
jgi:putative zinc finger/helix-turn-helix YgiT family protein